MKIVSGPPGFASLFMTHQNRADHTFWPHLRKNKQKMKTGWTTHSWNNAIWLALRPCHMTMTLKINKLEKPGGPLAIFMPYLADLLPFMVIFKRMLWRQSGPAAYHHQTEESCTIWVVLVLKWFGVIIISLLFRLILSKAKSVLGRNVITVHLLSGNHH